MTANDLTKDFLVAATAEFPSAVMWRSNRISATVMGRNGSKRRVEAGIDGQADITACIPVRFRGKTFGVRFEIEIKAGSDRQRTTQKAFEAAMRRAGGRYLIVRDCVSGISEIKELIAGMESEQ